MIKKNLTITFINILLLLFFIILAEYAYSFYREYWGTINSVYEPDNILGWAPKKNYQINKKEVDISGHEYRIKFSTNEYGFRSWGALEGKLKILILGDSFTGDPYTSDSDAYFSIMGNILDAEIFAFGGAGYGSLQEYLVLKKYVNIIEPDIFVLQFCSNDFVNNEINSEASSFVRNQSLRRPYLTEEGIVFRKNGRIYRLLANNFNIFELLDVNIQKIQYKMNKGYIKPERKQLVDSLFNESVKVTDEIFKMISNELPNKTLKLSFTCNTKEEKQTNAWKMISKENGFIPFENVALAVEKAEKEGLVVRYHDGGHWNILGNSIAGEQLANEIKNIISEKTE